MALDYCLWIYGSYDNIAIETNATYKIIFFLDVLGHKNNF